MKSLEWVASCCQNSLDYLKEGEREDTRMVPDASGWIGVIERVEILEKQNRRLKQVGAAILVVIISTVAMAQAPRKRTVEAEEFVLRDTNGKMRATLAMSPEGPGLVLFDSNGTARAMLEAVREGPRLTLHDANGQSRVGLTAFRVGEALGLSDANGMVRAGLFVTRDGPRLMLIEANGEKLFSVP